jgi:hypothetical protein
MPYSLESQVLPAAVENPTRAAWDLRRLSTETRQRQSFYFRPFAPACIRAAVLDGAER